MRPGWRQEGGWGVPVSIRRDRGPNKRLLTSTFYVPCGICELVGHARPSKPLADVLAGANADSPAILRSTCKGLQQAGRAKWCFVVGAAARRLVSSVPNAHQP